MKFAVLSWQVEKFSPQISPDFSHRRFQISNQTPNRISPNISQAPFCGLGSPKESLRALRWGDRRPSCCLVLLVGDIGVVHSSSPGPGEWGGARGRCSGRAEKKWTRLTRCRAQKSSRLERVPPYCPPRGNPDLEISRFPSGIEFIQREWHYQLWDRKLQARGVLKVEIEIFKREWSFQVGTKKTFSQKRDEHIKKDRGLYPSSTSECTDLLRSQLDPHMPLKLRKAEWGGIEPPRHQAFWLGWHVCRMKLPPTKCNSIRKG